MSNRYVWNKSNCDYEYARHGTNNWAGSVDWADSLPAQIYLAASPENIGLSFNSSNVFVPKTIQYPSQIINLTEDSPSYTVPAGTPFYIAGVRGNRVFYRADRSLKISLGEYSDSANRWPIEGSGIYELEVKASKGSFAATVSNSSSSTYPHHNYTEQITSICAIIPVLLRRYKHVA